MNPMPPKYLIMFYQLFHTSSRHIANLYYRRISVYSWMHNQLISRVNLCFIWYHRPESREKHGHRYLPLLENISLASFSNFMWGIKKGMYSVSCFQSIKRFSAIFNNSCHSQSWNESKYNCWELFCLSFAKDVSNALEFRCKASNVLVVFSKTQRF